MPGHVLFGDYRYSELAMLIAAGVVLQAMAIALGWFTALKDLDDGAVIDKNYDGNFGSLTSGAVAFGSPNPGTSSRYLQFGIRLIF